MTNNFLIIVSISLTLFACGQNNKDNSNAKKQLDTKELSIIEKSKTTEKKQVKEQKTEIGIDENVLLIKFNEFELIIDSLEIWDEKGKLKNVQKDSAIVYLELGETIEGQKIKLVQKKEGIINIYQRFENSVTIMDEGPHCDLTKWKHYNSEWKKLTINDGEFLTNSYSERDWEKFIEVDMNELREAVKKQCGERWAKHIKDIKLPNEYPSGVSMSRIFLKFEIIVKETNETFERIISFEIPMGC